MVPASVKRPSVIMLQGSCVRLPWVEAGKSSFYSGQQIRSQSVRKPQNTASSQTPKPANTSHLAGLIPPRAAQSRDRFGLVLEKTPELTTNPLFLSPHSLSADPRRETRCYRCCVGYFSSIHSYYFPLLCVNL